MLNTAQVMSRATLPDSATCKVVYNENKDTVVLEIGATSLRLEAADFMMMNEMMRKAAARLVMQTKIETV